MGLVMDSIPTGSEALQNVQQELGLEALRLQFENARLASGVGEAPMQVEDLSARVDALSRSMHTAEVRQEQSKHQKELDDAQDKAFRALHEKIRREEREKEKEAEPQVTVPKAAVEALKHAVGVGQPLLPTVQPGEGSTQQMLAQLPMKDGGDVQI
jgi:primosomal protein N''